MDDRLDDLLREALTPSEEPDVLLNEKILRKAKGEKRIIKKTMFQRIPVVIAAAMIVLLAGSLTAYGAWKYMTGEQVAEKIQDKKLTSAFRSKNAVRINDSWTQGEYKFTLLGLVSGKNLTDYTPEMDGEILADRSYVVVSIERKDGQSMEKDLYDTKTQSQSGQKEEQDMKTPFLVTPFIKGEDPATMNIYYMGGGQSCVLEDGIAYYMVAFDNLEVFAKRGVYLAVQDGAFYNDAAYAFDKKTGKITRKKQYQGINVLFDLPLDQSKGDEIAAKKQIKKWTDMHTTTIEVE